MRTFDKDELGRRVNEVLFYIWDPIGVAPEPCARAEYESYVPAVLRVLEESTAAGPISECLRDLMRSKMGLELDAKLCDETAELLLDHKGAIEEGLA